MVSVVALPANLPISSGPQASRCDLTSTYVMARNAVIDEVTVRDRAHQPSVVLDETALAKALAGMLSSAI